MLLVNTMFRFASGLAVGVAISTMMACSSGSDSSSSDASSSSTTTISGKVSVPASVAANKPGYAAKLMANQPHGKPGSKAYMASKKAAAPSGVQLPTGAYEKAFDLGAVWLYDANHPEWLYPVAKADVVAGSYTLSKTQFAELNGNAYKNDKPIPAGKYTLYAYDAADTGLIALKVIVKQYAGDVVGVDLVAEPSDVAPVVQTVLGAKKNTDGTYTWGSVANDSGDPSYISIFKNSAVQLSFSSAMNRISIKDNISIQTAAGVTVDGSWQVSPDWKTAVFKPSSGAFAAGNYVITVPGKDTSASGYVKNVYGNALANTSKGYFTVADAFDADAPATTVKLFNGGVYLADTQSSGVDVVTAIRLRSNELLDVATLDLTGTPSLGAKPTAAYIGKDLSDYIYEFTLGEPLKVGTSYAITVSGGKDLAGNTMVKSSRSFTTATAAGLDGISVNAGVATQNAQAQVKDVFGKWVRAMSDRNLAQVQSLMTGGYVYEYDASVSGINNDDINRDSRLSVNEFSSMLQSAFYGWEQCGTTLVGEVTADITVSGAQAGMEFKLSATSTGTSQICQQMAPPEKMYAVLEQINGAWYISRAAEGIDIRNKDLVLRDVVTLTSPAEGEVLTSNPATFEWQPIQGVTSYLLVIADDKGHGGMAVVVPSTTTRVAFTDNTLNGTGLTNIADVSFLFGADTEVPTPCVPTTSTNICTIASLDILREGATYKWEVMGLGSNTFESFKNGTYKDIFRDITAVSPLRTYKNSGKYLELTWKLLSSGVDVPYNDWYWAYDAGNAGTLTLKVTAPKSGTLTVRVEGGGSSSQTFTVSANSLTSIPLALYQGMNWVSMDFDDGTGFTLYDGFSVTTTGGIPPAITISSVADDSGAVYSACGTSPCIDQWSYLGGTSANTVTISGQVNLTQVPGAPVVGVSNWNAAGAYDYREVTVSATGSFTVTMDVYNGDNWFNFYTHDADWTYTGYSYLGINTSAGSVWTPPITVTQPSPNIAVTDYGGSQDWDASSETDNQITLSGTLTAPNASYPAQYYISSDGNWESGNLAVSGTSFTLPVTLYHGWNWVSIDDGSGHWYGVNIYTSSGMTPQLPVITSVAGQPFDINVNDVVTVDASATGCTVTVSGTLGASAGNALTAYWQGSDGVGGYYDQTSTSTDNSGHFSVTLPIVGDVSGSTGSYNYIDLYDSQWNWTGAVVYETSGCSYTPPVNTVTGATVNNGDTVTAFTADGYGGYDVALSTGAATAITLAGSNSKVGKTITGSMYSCGTYQTLEIPSASNGSWSLGQFNLYDGYNYISISDGYNSSYVTVNTSNGIVLPSPIALLSSTPAPSTQNWSDCSGASYNVDMGGGTTLAVNGVLNLTPGSQGSYDIGGTSSTFTSNASGNFTISVQVVNGDNYLYLYDGDWNSYYVHIYVTNGYTPPPAMVIDSPLHDASMTVGTFTVTGHIDSNQWSSLPTEYYGWAYDASSGVYVDYSSDATMQQTYGYLPMSVDNAGNFSFSAEILDAANYTEIYVYAYDPATGDNHGNVIYLNNVQAYSDSYWKPGARPAASRVAKNAIAAEHRIKRMTAIQAKARDTKRRLHR